VRAVTVSDKVQTFTPLTVQYGTALMAQHDLHDPALAERSAGGVVQSVHCPSLGGLKPSPLGDGFSTRAAG
jgi:hypothetical protein